MTAAVVLHLTVNDLLLLAPVPFLLTCFTFMLAGLFDGPTGGFKMVLTKGWIVVALPTIGAGLYGIARAVAS